jgi:hypothetical protein
LQQLGVDCHAPPHAASQKQVKKYSY